MPPLTSQQFNDELAELRYNPPTHPAIAVKAWLHGWFARAVDPGAEEGLRWHVLFEAACLDSRATSGDLRFGDAAWQFYRDLAQRADEQGDSELKEYLRIMLFEVIAEPPHYEENLRLLFGLLDEPATRWAVFAAYHRWPRTFRRHIAQYGRGRITGAEYAAWLRGRGLVLAARGLRFIDKEHRVKIGCQ